VSRRRFWRGNFLFHDDPVYGGPGFKRFRPVVVDDRAGARPLTNSEIAAHRDWGDYSLEQYELGVDGFYDRVEDVLSPEKISARQVFLETVDALEEQVRGRVISVQNAIDYKKGHPGAIDMPEGAEIFETTGAWEDYSTPSRDMRLLIAIEVARTLPARLLRRKERWLVEQGKSIEQVATELEKLLEAESKKRIFEYQRSDGSTARLSLADVLARTRDLEMAYNPNDCPEIRWAAPEGSDEQKTCAYRAPASQTQRMEGHRPWFATRTRPPRP
jgi:hypothetical protein